MFDIENSSIDNYLPVLSKACELYNYSFFTKGDYNLNIIGIRNINRTANTFNDKMCLLFKIDNNWVTKVYNCTTDPGTYWLNNPMSKLGTAIIVPYQYKGVYKIGLHKGQYEALCQQTGVNIAVYRDNNKDNILDYDPRTIESGIFGTNIHRAKLNGTSIEVNKWSAGCQVIANNNDFNEFMDICHKSSKIYSNKFTYTLFDQRQLIS